MNRQEIGRMLYESSTLGRKYGIEKISNFSYQLEELPRAIQETAQQPEGFIKGAVVFH
jgi:hypothetical protein